MDRIEIEARLSRVERRSRAASTIATLTTLALGALLLTGFRAHLPEEVVAAQRFELVDANGAIRAEIGIDADGSAGFFLRDAEGGLRASLVHDAAETGLFLMDEKGVIRVGSAQFAHGGGGFALHGEGSEGSAVLYLKDGKGRLTLIDADGALLGKFPD